MTESDELIAAMLLDQPDGAQPAQHYSSISNPLITDAHDQEEKPAENVAEPGQQKDTNVTANESESETSGQSSKKKRKHHHHHHHHRHSHGKESDESSDDDGSEEYREDPEENKKEDDGDGAERPAKVAKKHKHHHHAHDEDGEVSEADEYEYKDMKEKEKLKLQKELEELGAANVRVDAPRPKRKCRQAKNSEAEEETAFCEKLVDMEDDEVIAAVTEAYKADLAAIEPAVMQPVTATDVPVETRTKFVKLAAISCVRKDLVDAALGKTEAVSYEKYPAWADTLEKAIKLSNDFEVPTSSLMKSVSSALRLLKNIDPASVCLQFVAFGCITRACQPPLERNSHRVAIDECARCQFTGKPVLPNDTIHTVAFEYIDEQRHKVVRTFKVSDIGKEWLFDLYAYKHWKAHLTDMMLAEYQNLRRAAGETTLDEFVAVEKLQEFGVKLDNWKIYDNGHRVAYGLLHACVASIRKLLYEPEEDDDESTDAEEEQGKPADEGGAVTSATPAATVVKTDVSAPPKDTPGSTH